MNSGSQAVAIQLRNLSEQCILQPKMMACSSKSMAYVQLLLYLFGYISSNEKMGGFENAFGTAVYTIHGKEHQEDYTANRLITLPRISNGVVAGSAGFKDNKLMATMKQTMYDLRHGPDSVSFQSVTMFKNTNIPSSTRGFRMTEDASAKLVGKKNNFVYQPSTDHMNFQEPFRVQMTYKSTLPPSSRQKTAKIYDFMHFNAKSRADDHETYISSSPEVKNFRGPCIRRPFKFWITHTRSKRGIRTKRDLERQPANTLSSKMKFLLSHHLNKSSVYVETPNAEDDGNSTTAEGNEKETNNDELDDTDPNGAEPTTEQQDQSLEAYRESQDDNIRDIIENIKESDSVSTTETPTTTEMNALEKLKHMKNENKERKPTIDPHYQEKQDIEKMQKRKKLHQNLLIGRGTKKYTTPAPNEADYSYSYHKPKDIQKIKPAQMQVQNLKAESAEAGEEDEGQNTNVQEEVLEDNEHDQGVDERSQEANDHKKKPKNNSPYVTYDQVLRVRDKVPPQYAIHEPENEGEQTEDQRQPPYQKYEENPANTDDSSAYQKYEESPTNPDDSSEKSTADDPTDPFPSYDPIEHKFNSPGDFEEHEKKINTINFIQKQPDTDNEQNNEENNEAAEADNTRNDEQAEDASVEEQPADPEENDVEQQIQQFDQMFDDDHEREDETATVENDESEDPPEREAEEQEEGEVTEPDEGEEEKEEVEEQEQHTSDSETENDQNEDNEAEVDAESDSNPQNQEEEQTTSGYGYIPHHPTNEYNSDYDTGSDRPVEMHNGFNYPVQYVNPTHSTDFNAYPQYYLTPPRATNRPPTYVPPLDYSAIYNSFPKSKNNVEMYKLPNIYQKHEYSIPPKRQNVPNHRPHYAYDDEYRDGITMESSQEETTILGPISLKSSEELSHSKQPDSIEYSGEKTKLYEQSAEKTSMEEPANLLSSSSISSEEETTLVDPKLKFPLGSPVTDFPRGRKPKKDKKIKKPTIDGHTFASDADKEKKIRTKFKKQFRNTTQKPKFSLVKHFIEQEDQKPAGHSAFYRPEKKKANIFQVGDKPILKQFHSLFDSLATGTNNQLNKNIHLSRNLTSKPTSSDKFNKTKKLNSKVIVNRTKMARQNVTNNDQKLGSSEEILKLDLLVKTPQVNATVNNTVNQVLKPEEKNKTSVIKPKVRGKIASLIQKLKSDKKNFTTEQTPKPTNQTIKPLQKKERTNDLLDQRLVLQITNSTLNQTRSIYQGNITSEPDPTYSTIDKKKVQNTVLEKLRRLGKVLGGRGIKYLNNTTGQDLKTDNSSTSLVNLEYLSKNGNQSLRTSHQNPEKTLTVDGINAIRQNSDVPQPNLSANPLEILTKNKTTNHKDASDESHKIIQEATHKNHKNKNDFSDFQNTALEQSNKSTPQKIEENIQLNNDLFEISKNATLVNNKNEGIGFDFNNFLPMNENAHESFSTTEMVPNITDKQPNGADDENTNRTNGEIAEVKEYQPLAITEDQSQKDTNRTDSLMSGKLTTSLGNETNDRGDNAIDDQLRSSPGDQMTESTDQQMAASNDQSILYYTKPDNCDLTTGWCGLETFNSTVTHKVGIWPFRKTYVQQDERPDTKETQIEQFLQKIRQQGEEYDFIIIGAGSAGCVLANRLTEIRHWRVLLLEAGTEEPFIADVPALAPLLQGSSIDWGFLHEPSNRSCKSRPMGRCGWAQGKVMGGSSAINFMMYTRGNAADYDEWAHLGNSGWSFRDVLPYFKKAEDNGDPDIYNANPDFHGVGGYQPVERLPEADQNVAKLIQMWREMGLEERDLQAERQIGVMHVQTTTRNGERMSTNRAYIRPIRQSRPNLIIRTQATVTRILVGRERGGAVRAIGVEYTMANKQRVAIARKEVILSAGAINSPKLLMLSGIGPEEHLRRMNINVVKNLRVGENLQDHVTTDGVIVGLPKTSTQVSWKKKKSDALKYQKTRRGPLASTGAIQVTVFVNTDCNSFSEVPDIQYSYDGADLSDFLFSPELMSAMRRDPLGYYDAMSIRPVLMKPLSRGRVLLNETDPFKSPPLIHSGYFTRQEDVDVMVAGIKLAIEAIETTKVMQEIGASMIAIPLAGCEQYEWGTDEYWACHIMTYTATIFHPAGTCKMGPSSDPTAVVDPRLRVHGVKSLRVIDSSIMPKIARGNTNAVTIMIAEKGSDMIKEDWASKPGG